MQLRKHYTHYTTFTLLIVGFLLFNAAICNAQIMPNGQNQGIVNNNPFSTADSNMQDSTKTGKKWSNPPAKIYYTTIRSAVKQYMDTGIQLLHRRIPTDEKWYYHLGNYGTASLNIRFTPLQNPGPALGYSVYETYDYSLSALPYFNTTRPYSSFNYSLGSKQEQVASLLHTQNVSRNFNIAFHIKNINSPGFFNGQLSTFNGGYFSSNYLSNNNRYSAKLGIVYNRNRSDENGGILADSLLLDSRYVDRAQIPTVLKQQISNSRRSRTTNTYRDIDAVLENYYRWGIADTLYNEDSTAITPRFTPVFGIKHQLSIRSEKHLFEDRYAEYQNYRFIADSLPIQNADTLRNNQLLTTISNRFSFNGFLGRSGRQARIEAGIGNRLDFVKDDVSNNSYKSTLVNNYAFATIDKEALDSLQWGYGADATFYFAGSASGDFILNAYLGKHIKSMGGFRLSFSQSLSTAPLSFQRFATNYFVNSYDLQKQSVTKVAGEINVEKIGLEIGAANYLLGNYIYYDETWKLQQHHSVFNVLQLYLTHSLRAGNFRMLTEALVQQKAGEAPVNLPFAVLRLITAYENYVFKSKLFLTAGFDFSYHTPYTTPGYIPFYNQFFYRTGSTTSNIPTAAVFLNFKVRTFRMFISVDQLQQTLQKKNIMYFPGYPMQNTMLRFGIQWTMYN